ncbi:unnamed protein product [Ilex paraguariensis]|uniref:CRAL-TRIO domain-containing protein n=1 Tax=Ilex paraguariensis TaxID=185542 RepID=A0ABC8UDQ5_9AQUA
MNSSSPSPSPLLLSQSEQQRLIEKLEIFKIQGKDKHGHKVLRIIGKLFPARIVGVEALKKYLEERVFPSLGEQPFSVVYLDTGANRGENFPGVSVLRSVYNAIPVNVRDNLEAVYFVHPGFQSRLFLASIGLFLFSGGLYRKLKYVSRLEYLWDNVRKKEIEIPEFVYNHDQELEYYPMIDYGLESDHPRLYDALMVNYAISTYSMRRIA